LRWNDVAPKIEPYLTAGSLTTARALEMAPKMSSVTASASSGTALMPPAPAPAPAPAPPPPPAPVPKAVWVDALRENILGWVGLFSLCAMPNRRCNDEVKERESVFMW